MRRNPDNLEAPLPSRRAVLLMAAAAGLALLAPAGSGRAAGTVANFIERLGDEAIRQLAASDIDSGEREARFRMLLEENFDLPRITRFVLGRYVRSASPEEIEQFRVLYADLAVLTYANLFASYSGQRFTVKRRIGAPGERYAMIISEIQSADGQPPIKLDWQVLIDGEDFAVVDIRVEGVSMAIAQRDEFTAVLDRNGGDMAGLLSELRDKVDRLRAGKAKS